MTKNVELKIEKCAVFTNVYYTRTNKQNLRAILKDRMTSEYDIAL